MQHKDNAFLICIHLLSLKFSLFFSFRNTWLNYHFWKKKKTLFSCKNPLSFNKGPLEWKWTFPAITIAKCISHVQRNSSRVEEHFCQKQPKPSTLCQSAPKKNGCRRNCSAQGWEVYTSSFCDIYSKVSPSQRLSMLMVAGDVQFDKKKEKKKVHAAS